MDKNENSYGISYSMLAGKMPLTGEIKIMCPPVTVPGRNPILESLGGKD